MTSLSTNKYLFVSVFLHLNPCFCFKIMFNVCRMSSKAHFQPFHCSSKTLSSMEIIRQSKCLLYRSYRSIINRYFSVLLLELKNTKDDHLCILAFSLLFNFPSFPHLKVHRTRMVLRSFFYSIKL